MITTLSTKSALTPYREMTTPCPVPLQFHPPTPYHSIIAHQCLKSLDNIYFPTCDCIFYNGKEVIISLSVSIDFIMLDK